MCSTKEVRKYCYCQIFHSSPVKHLWLGISLIHFFLVFSYFTLFFIIEKKFALAEKKKEIFTAKEISKF